MGNLHGLSQFQILQLQKKQNKLKTMEAQSCTHLIGLGCAK